MTFQLQGMSMIHNSGGTQEATVRRGPLTTKHSTLNTKH